MARARNGEAIRADRRTSAAIAELNEFIRTAEKRSDLDEWRRGRAILGYINGQRVVDLAAEFDVTRGSVNRWLQWFDATGVEGLKTLKAPGPQSKLSAEQRRELTKLIEAGPIAAGYQSGVWTGPMVGDLIEERFGIHYHRHHVPRLLNELGFSVQRPRKRLARADAEQQNAWVKTRFPAIKKKPMRAGAS